MIRKYPSIFLLACIVSGIVMADQLHLPVWMFFFLSILAVSGGMVAWIRRERTIAILSFGLCLAGFAGLHYGANLYDTGPTHLRELANTRAVYRIYGCVTDWPDLKADRTEIRISIDSLTRGTTVNTRGAILLKVTDTTTALQRGDRIEFTGRIYPMSAGRSGSSFDYGRYLNLKGVYGIVYLPTLLDVRVDRRSRLGLLHLVDGLRDAVRSSLNRNLAPRQAALAGGFLIGETRHIPPSVYAMFRDSGTLHLLAVSGSNVALVVLFVMFIMRPFGISRRRRALVLLAVILVFTELAYEEPSVVRAAIMAALVIGAGLLERKYDLNNIIAFTAVIILLYDPAQLYDVGFQLSFITAWGLILFVPILAGLWAVHHGRKWYRYLIFPLVVSLVAQVVSTPVIAFYFGRVPAISIVANLVIVPLVSVGVVGILITLVADLIWPVLGLLAGSLLDRLLAAVVWVLQQMGGENMVVIKTAALSQGDSNAWFVVAAYLAMVLLVLSIKHRYLRKTSLAFLLLATNIALLAAVFTGEKQYPRAEFVRVPGGVMAVVRTSENANADLVLTGLEARDYPIDERILLPWLEERSIARVGRIFVLSAAYNAIDDLLRLAGSADVDSVFMAPDLKRSVSDVMAGEQMFDSLNTKIAFLHNEPERAGSVGIHACFEGLKIVTENSYLVFAQRIVTVDDASPGLGLNGTLVIGETWKPAAGDWISLSEAGYETIICSKIEPYLPEGTFDSGGDPDQILPDYLKNLSRLGTFELPLN